MVKADFVTRVGRGLRRNFGSFTRWAVLPVAAAALLLAGCGGTKNIAVVNGQPITQKQFLDMVEAMPQGAQMLNQLIVVQALQQDAKAQGVAPTDAEVQKLLTETEAQQPAFAAALAQNRTLYTDQIRARVALNNLTLKDADVSPTAVKKWFDAHRSLFDQPAKASVVLLVFDDLDRAKKGKTLLAKGSTPTQVADSLGTPAARALAAQPSPLESKDEMSQAYQMYGPDLQKAISQMFAPGVKTGYVTDPVKFTGRYALLQLVQQAVPKAATLAANEDMAKLYMAAAQYAQKTYHYTIPDNAPLSSYGQVAQSLQSKLLQDVMQSYKTKNLVKINNANLQKQFDQQFAGSAATAGAPAGAPTAGAPPAGAPAGASTPTPAAAAEAAPAPGGGK